MREPNQLRKIAIKKNFIRYPEGSVLIAQGHTKVICNATVEAEVPRFKKNSGEGWVTAEYAMLPRSTHTRMDRESKQGRQSGRTQEISRLVGRALRSVCDMKALGERQIIVDCEVIQADGGTRCASINGGFIALALAIQSLLKKQTITANPLRGPVAAISCGVIQGVPTLDLNYEQDSTADVDMNFVMTSAGHYVEIQGTAEQKPFTNTQMEAMKKLAWKGIGEVMQVQNRALR